MNMRAAVGGLRAVAAALARTKAGYALGSPRGITRTSTRRVARLLVPTERNPPVAVGSRILPLAGPTEQPPITAPGIKRTASLPGFLAVLLLATPGPAAESPRVFRVRDYGAVADGQTESGNAIRKTIRAALASGAAAEVVLEPGVYRVQPAAPRTACFPIHQATNLVVRGAGTDTRILITDPAASGFAFTLGRQVALRDLLLDYDPLPFCQGTIRTLDRLAGSFDLEVEAGFPTPDAPNFVGALEPYGKWGMIMDPSTRRIRSGTPDHFMTPRWEPRGNRVWRFHVADEHHRHNLQHMRVGDAYVHLARGHGSAVFAQACDGVRIENLTVQASPGLVVGLVANRGDLVVRRLNVRFAPGATRLLTANADGVHCQQNRSGPVIEDCTFEGMADDAINLYAPPVVLREIRSPVDWLVSPGVPILPGDRFQVLDPRSGRLRGQVTALEVTPESRALRLRIDRPVDGAVAGTDHRTADTLYNLDACGAGFRIRRNHMNGNRRYGCLLRAGDGVVEDNVFADTTGAGVVLTNEPDWPEGPVPWGITVRRNRFLRGGTCLGYADSPHGAALVVRASRLGHGLAEAEALRDVIVEDNDFVDRAGLAVFVGGASRVALRANRITAAPEAPRFRPGPAILVERSSAVSVVDNTVSDPRPRSTGAVEFGPDAAPGETRAAAGETVPSVAAIDVSGFRDGAHHWRNIRDTNRVIQALPGQATYAPSQIREIVGNILLFQRANGGWPKDYDMLAVLTDEQAAALRATRDRQDTSFDNHNTHSQVAYLARACGPGGDPAGREACRRGFDFLLAAQYPQGGFPQRFPNPTGYAAHITFNDGVMIGILDVLREAAGGEPQFAWLDQSRRERAREALKRGVECLLKCQIRVGDRLTGWCQQHDQKTFEARPARTFELASLCPQDTTEIAGFLLRLDEPDDAVRRAVEAAVAWLSDVALAGIRIETVPAPREEFLRHTAEFDRVIVPDPNAPPLWARHYEIGTGRPVFAGRDGVRRYSLAEIERERRTGTVWYGTWPRRLLESDYPTWRAKSVPR
jgi:PelA/Pel-15E family pectate lyase